MLAPLEVLIVFSGSLYTYLDTSNRISAGVVPVLRTRASKLAKHGFQQTLKIHPSGPPGTMLEESASHHVVREKAEEEARVPSKNFCRNIVRQHKEICGCGTPLEAADGGFT